MRPLSLSVGTSSRPGPAMFSSGALNTFSSSVVRVMITTAFSSFGLKTKSASLCHLVLLGWVGGQQSPLLVGRNRA